MGDKPDVQHGRLLESMHIAGYSFERACRELKWLLEEDRWKECGEGYERIDDFLATVDLSRFKQSLNERKELTQLLANAKATQRAIAGAVGVSHTTVQNDVRGGKKLPRNPPETPPQERETVDLGNKLPTPDPLINLSADDVVKNAEAPAITKAKKSERKAEVERMVESGAAATATGAYRVLYADPPWKYSTEQHSGKEQATTLGTHYPSMSTEDICALAIPETEPDAVLFLWATSPLILHAFRVMESWGFVYKAQMIWDKVKHNVGHYVSVRHEILLIGTKGSCTPDVKKLHDSVHTEERTEHSRKPEHFREVIDTIYPIGRRVELFARGKLPDSWDGWGNQYEK